MFKVYIKHLLCLRQYHSFHFLFSFVTHTYSRLFVICAAIILLICAGITPLSHNSDGHEMHYHYLLKHSSHETKKSDHQR